MLVLNDDWSSVQALIRVPSTFNNIYHLHHQHLIWKVFLGFVNLSLSNVSKIEALSPSASANFTDGVPLLSKNKT